ncbi:MAG: CsbD family protein [Planctomycetota bacterium]
MSGTSDEIKGRIKEAAGAITDDDKLRREGKLDQAAGKVKQTVEKVVDKIKNAAQGKSND